MQYDMWEWTAALTDGVGTLREVDVLLLLAHGLSGSLVLCQFPTDRTGLLWAEVRGRKALFL